MADILIEICVDDGEGLEQALTGGADRIELCAALALGGLTPSAGFMAHAARRSPVPVHAMIRPRAGDFVFDAGEVRQMEADIGHARAAGLAGVVLGASRPDGRLDAAILRRLIGAAAGMDLTLHRAFDLTPDRGEALELAIDLGFDRVLTSGGARTAIDGAGAIADLIGQARGRIAIMPGSGITAATVLALRHLPLTAVHASCAEQVPVAGRVVDLGFAGPGGMRRTSAAAVRALRAALAD
ncbi:copper homeostasis protein CutC [Aliigemmobacter aestuarii]|uniref:PF03932 family protein CutC n=1 Tax=Aliigemmobacter aestuarii TaxID=1445661 RepID=A0A4S3MUD7_9RHOB|nr:copper homeostasis protein CutC [Gemmobacter aestuarii]THD85764.1 copper homeostasis protein CutC [Gemmobacter aestuarii]